MGTWGKGGAVMPGKGKIVEREYRGDERAAIEEWIDSVRRKDPGFFATVASAQNDISGLLGEKTCDVYLNGVAYWRNIPRAVWEYTIGGYQVIKKWLSYRERDLMGRGLRMDEARTVTAIARRIAVIIAMGPTLDRNYAAIKSDCYGWRSADSGIADS